ncbi:MAG: hypothetical protein RL713_1866, partial [Bacteroidota bacterium]
MSIFAGNGAAGSTDGVGTTAKFNGLNGITIDASGNFYVVDSGNHLIRKITPNGNVSTTAGSVGVVGSSDGIGSDARFNSPSGITVDSSGNVFVTDMSNHIIRKITPNGNVTTIAGYALVVGSTNAFAQFASFNNPVGIVCDSSGNLYVGDYSNNMIRKITPGRTVTTIVSTSSPQYVTLDSFGNLFYILTLKIQIVIKCVNRTCLPSFMQIFQPFSLGDVNQISEPLNVTSFSGDAG